MGLQKFKLNYTDQLLADHDVEITIYTDPLCCWSWAFQPQLAQLKKELGNKATWEFKMGGLISTWANFNDEVNSVSRPGQMGPVWMHAGQIANMPIEHQLWMKDPPASSYPACVAVKSVQLQSQEYGVSYLQLLREACMGEGKNIAKQSVLFDIAETLALNEPHFYLQKFKDDYENGRGMDAFRSDLNEVRFYNISRFPTLILRSRNEKAILISGYRRYPEILEAIKTLGSGKKI
ncbi:MAG: DsbA family protein [Bacteroidota bacterium]|nr:DsbA family protein [Bacteroidota bacterium]